MTIGELGIPVTCAGEGGRIGGTQILLNPPFESANIELSRVISRHRSSRVTLTRALTALQVFFHSYLCSSTLNIGRCKSRKPYSFVDLGGELCYSLSSF